MISGTTELLAIVGSPIAQVKSPQNFNAWFARHGEDASMIPIDLERESLDAFVRTLRAWRNLRGCVITVPYKQAIAARIDTLTERARALESVNVIRREADGTLAGDMLDGDGFLKAAREHGFSPRGARALVVGAGGAGSAIAWALCEHGAAALTLVDLDASRTQRLRALLRARFPAVDTGTQVGSLAAFDLVVNASPAGMPGNDVLPLAETRLATLRADTLVADVVTTPDITRFLALARRAGCRIQTGAEMALAQFDDLRAFMTRPLAA
ncbi:shikimate dehydrogenase [Burkholderia multivorans]|uniref:shikimate dehydrogenase family protein n=1 Tax=Burkholderia multivorans TaxID=87883 RepID=UPI001C26BF4B|nr:shikimate dehydrogenase [Burkholderia multivorans]MBU9561071.1 shikimate dehydrogenase [Burkholderia multivorans]